MPLDGAWNAYIFREGKTILRGSELLNGLVGELLTFGEAGPQARRNALLDLLIRSGEMEGALLDSASDQSSLVASITDRLAFSLVAGEPLQALELALQARSLNVPDQVSVTAPEGFAYYALHPLDFADLISEVELPGRFAAIVGIRSIGTTLSAVVQASLWSRGVHGERTTVRPVGHPYDRRTEFSPEQLQWIATMLSREADFLVVDEGPGMSGSSFLSVGDALISAGVPRSKIAFLGSRVPHPPSLTARDAATRWPAYRHYATRPTRHLPHGAKLFIAGGIWRAEVYGDQQQWPASWLQMERLKFTSAERDVFFKFEGYGRFGQAVHNRSKCVADAGFGPTPMNFDEGFGIYPMLRGKPLSVSDLTPSVLQRIADYCAFRATAMQAPVADNAGLESMLRFNVKEEFRTELSPTSSKLALVKPVIADGRMLPHKWIDSDGALLKVDSAIHGDDHFFPGPTDIAWDLAGTIVEWEMDPNNASDFLGRYFRSSGDDAQHRIGNYLLAYSVFRTAFCKMASASMHGSEEELRLLRDYHRYRLHTQRYLEQGTEGAVLSKPVPIEAPAELRIA
jgi:hypothetical protein